MAKNIIYCQRYIDKSFNSHNAESHCEGRWKGFGNKKKLEPPIGDGGRLI